MRWQYRGLIAAGVGAGLVLVWWAVFHTWPRLVLEIVPSENCGDLGCALGAALVSLMLTVAVVLSLSLIMGWLALHAAGVRPALWPALLGPLIGWVIAILANPILPEHSFARLALPIAAGYGLAAILSTPRKA